MDAKALAKSKRAHSLHHSKKPHSIQKSKAQSGGTSGDAGSGNKALGKQQAKEKARQPSLPSNWDRYEEEFDLGSEDQSVGSSSKATDVVLPKSKGADYSHLIAEARSQQSNSLLDSFPSIDDILPGDLKLGVGPMLSVRGEGILSWTGDDNFVVEDETTANPEAQFLSLNLNALAEQLAKVDLSKRLFIEEDLLPPELTDDRKSTSESLEVGRSQTSATEARPTESEELALEDLSDKNKVGNEDAEVVSSLSTVNGQKSPVSFNQGFDLLSRTKDDLDSSQDSKYTQSAAMGNTAEFNASPVEVLNKKLSTFEATAAEAELDMLLDSFSETKFLDSPGVLSGTFPASQKDVPAARPQTTRSAPSSSKTTVGAGFDDILDDLLEEASNLSNHKSSYQLGKAIATSNETQSSSSSSSFSQSVSKSKVLDGFDSWLDTI